MRSHLSMAKEALDELKAVRKLLERLLELEEEDKR